MTNEMIKKLIAKKEEEIKELKKQLKRETFLVKATCEKTFAQGFMYHGNTQARQEIEIKQYFKTEKEAKIKIEKIKEKWSQRRLEHINHYGHGKHYVTYENIVIKLNDIVVFSKQ